MIITAKVAVRIALLVLLFVLLQSVFFSMIEVFGTPFWILPALAVIFGLLGGSMVGATIGFSIGFLSDALADGPLGSAGLVFMGLGYVAGLYRERVDQIPAMAAAVVAGVATLVANLALGVFTVVLGFDAYLSASALPEIVLQSVYGLLLAVPLFLLVRRVLRPALVEERMSRSRRPTVFEG